ncbi:hypothetical protein HK405_003741 [Cladochytrium tenue]|nr:hypothetical protein HK405_003741 [Cladochytrium tenue]
MVRSIDTSKFSPFFASVGADGCCKVTNTKVMELRRKAATHAVLYRLVKSNGRLGVLDGVPDEVSLNKTGRFWEWALSGGVSGLVRLDSCFAAAASAVTVVGAEATTTPAAVAATATPPSLDDINALLPDIGLEVQDSCIHKWTVESWSELKDERKVYGPEFTCLGAKWRVLLFPNGNQQNDTLSVFLDSVDAATAPKNTNWHICVQFALAIANPEDEKVYKASTAQHRYNTTEADWGFNHLVKLSQLTIASEAFPRPLVENDKTTIVVHMKVMKDITGVLWHNFVESVSTLDELDLALILF